MSPLPSRLLLASAALAAVLVAALPGRATSPALRFRVYAYGLPKLAGIVWTGSRFLYVENTANTVWSAPPAGSPITRFASMPRLVEETRCVQSPGAHGFPAGAIFCHSPDHKIYELSADGRAKKVLATLPAPFPPAGDGALAFDTVGRFGFRLIAATGRSGAGQPPGGLVFAVDARGGVRKVGSYPGPGAADELAIAPPHFGSAAGDVLLGDDAGAAGGSLVAMAPGGQTRVLATFPDGLNPIVPLVAAAPRRGLPPAGLYLTDDTRHFLYHAPDAPLRQYVGGVLVASEIKALFWVVSPRGSGFTSIPIRTNFGSSTHSLEAMIQVP